MVAVHVGTRFVTHSILLEWVFNVVTVGTSFETTNPLIDELK